MHKTEARNQVPLWADKHYFELPCEADGAHEVHVYTDHVSYAPGDVVNFHASTNSDVWGMEIQKDGLAYESVLKLEQLPGTHFSSPSNCYEIGCDWPVAYSWNIPVDASSGFYLVKYWCKQEDGRLFIRHHFFVVRPVSGDPDKILMILPTCTWLAYNDWGGANHYRGIAGELGKSRSPVLSLNRPWARGLVWLPEDAPRVSSLFQKHRGSTPHYATKEWAFSNQYCFYYASAGWAQFDRHFYRWALSENYKIDMITQHDIVQSADLMKSYKCVVIVGHDEYWSSEMRDTLDHYIEQGGNVARFAGNFLWQIRLENAGKTQVCYKDAALEQDPYAYSDKHHLTTGAWEDKEINRPGVHTFGVNALRGMYASWGGFSPNGSGGFTVYRPEHWSFESTSIRYADLLGANSGVLSYEVDGIDYTFRNGLPYPTGMDGAPSSIEILALTPASLAEDVLAGDEDYYYVGDSDLKMKVQSLEGQITAEGMAQHRYGCGVVVHMHKGNGQVYCAGSCEWVAGLIRNDAQIRQTTSNVINRFLNKA